MSSIALVRPNTSLMKIGKERVEVTNNFTKFKESFIFGDQDRTILLLLLLLLLIIQE